MLHFPTSRPRRTALALATSILIGSLTSAAFAAAPMQKVQSGYLHIMLGKFEITAISDGTVDLPMEKLLAEPIEDTKKALNRAFLDDPTETSVNAFLVNTGDRLVLVDTGAGQLFGPTLGKLVANIQAAGYSLDQIDDVVLTHLHPDHVGGLMWDGKMVFPKATIYAGKADTDLWLSEAAKKKDGDASHFFAGAMASLSAYVQSGQLKPFTGDREIVPGIKAVSAHGHTPGHVVYQVDSDGKRMYIIGDLIHVESVQFAKPTVTIGFDSDQKAAEASREEFFAKIAKEGDLVGAAHLSFPGLGHIRAQANSYEWLPLRYSTRLD
ncbi:glyoxylase-like metal-dependent hydrolase (beta-lactamase superfamily II) [Rhizobium mesoamericanum]|uniref:MBL fold metallo-hydrolase n=1 Tax=Rhizobium mesoamericanum TaxID=1079800 RepID=UPI00277D70C2|nr:MBL fold metallo-hydrolase [Rhizobium mesoamericanum]MDQ0561975.1 glyoxylase-like metal-dependent hydrolase (beta-lactamase superfamily II) [Rhizobium mesoamericanum]